ncbi:MAG: SDR family oxidoreductase [Saprospiraceae bacterium]|nr:SDR family oxidoreductase [Saprospiraceae bacterium]
MNILPKFETDLTNTENQKPKTVLVTGGAGFIGSNLVEALLNNNSVAKVRVLDNLSTGFRKNIEEYLSHSGFEFIEGDIRDMDSCMKACEGVDLISHQAALGSVPRSIKDPLTTNAVNIDGTLNILYAAVRNNIRRVVFASSSSVYGDSPGLPKVEDKTGRPLSPYAVTKLVNEIYADVFYRTYGLEYIGLRYFNVFGPKQDPEGPYAAVIPLFFKAALEEKSPVINGDGTHSRDFTYVDNAVEANLLALFTENADAINQIYNVACGEQTSLNQLWETIQDITKTRTSAVYGPPRTGDIPHSLADIGKISERLNYSGRVKLKEGLIMSLPFYQDTIIENLY